MADELWDELQNLALGRDDPILFIPREAYASVEARNSLSLIARPLNPRAQNLHTVIASLPRTWGLLSNVHGRVLDSTFVQFLFQSEADLLSVQRRAPWIFNNWFVASQIWEDLPDLDFLTTIDLWVQIRGIPLPYVSEECVAEIAQELGTVIKMDFHEATTTQIAFIRVRVRFGIHDCLRFFKRVRFESGETAVIRFQYEHLRRICSKCFRITHHRSYCPYQQDIQVPRNIMDAPMREERERLAEYDELHRSDLNSQSQISEISFPEPISQSPRVDIPGLFSEERASANLSVLNQRPENIELFDAQVPQASGKKQDVSTGSNTTPKSKTATNTRVLKVYEIGESSKRYEKGESSKRQHSEVEKKKEDKRNIKQRVQESMDGGFLKPPKKR